MVKPTRNVWGVFAQANEYAATPELMRLTENKPKLQTIAKVVTGQPLEELDDTSVVAICAVYNADEENAVRIDHADWYVAEVVLYEE
jgi:hypothetical protein